MRLQVKFRFREDTGEVEIFQVTSIEDGPRDPRHDELHERAARDLARVVDPQARVIEEVPPDATSDRSREERPDVKPEENAERQEPQRQEPQREEPRREEPLR